MKIGYKNVWILTMDMDFSEYPKGFLVFEEDKIISLGSMEEYREDSAEYWIDGKGGILMPGMINGHVHCGMIPFRSLGDDTKDRLRRFLFPLEEECVNKALIEKSSAYAMAEMQLSGITTICDMYYEEDTVAEVAEKMGMRALVGETVINQKTPDSESYDEALLYCENMMKRWEGSDLIAALPAPHAPNTNTDESLRECLALSEKYKVPLTMHFAEMQYEMAYYTSEKRMGAVEYLESLGLFSVPLILAHCILLSEEDIERMSGHAKVGVIHCIGANTKAAKGVAPIKALLNHNIPVGIGTDGPASGNTLDLFTQMRMIANFQKNTLQDRSAFPAREIVAMATIGGARALGIEDKVGSLEIGKKADFILLETNSINMFPIHDPYSVLVYSARAENVSDVWIDGKQVVKNKKLCHGSVDTLRKELSEQMGVFVKRAKELSYGIES